MSNDYDPRLQAIFTQAQQSFDHDAFLRSILERIDKERRRTMMVWSVFGVAGIIVLALLAKPVFTALTMATQLLPMSLVEIEVAWLRQLVSPINSIAAVLAIAVLGIRSFIRRFLR